MVKSKEWPTSKILQLAKMHVAIVNVLKPLYLENIQDIHHIINDKGNSLLQGMLSLLLPEGSPLYHSMHNIGQRKLKIIFVKSAYQLAAIEQLGSIHEILYSKVPIPYHKSVFLPSAKVALTSRQNDTISSCNYSSYANHLSSTYTSHTLNNENTSPLKRPRIVHLSYSAAVSTVSATTPSTPQPTKAPSAISGLTTQDPDSLFEKMKPYIKSEASTSNITIEELEGKNEAVPSGSSVNTRGPKHGPKHLYPRLLTPVRNDLF